MGYLHIDNLYKSQDILLFRECYALEKVHGSSAHISFKDGVLRFFAGGGSHERFVKIFDEPALKDALIAVGTPEIIVFGEVYGGKRQGMSATYGIDLCFIAFDVKVLERWLSVPDAEQITKSLGLEFVPYTKCPTDLAILDQFRDAPSEVAVRRGCGTREREGVVLRPLEEFTNKYGERVIAKHKLEKFSERTTPQKVVDPDKLVILEAANAIAQEWVTENRLTNIIDKYKGSLAADPVLGIEATGAIIKAMVEDVRREAAGEIVWSKDAERAIGKRAAQLFKERLEAKLRSGR